MPKENETLPNRPLPRRPRYGFLAWQATMGHISQQFSLDALLTIQVYPFDDTVAWSAEVSWAQEVEQVRDRPTLSTALRDLWREVSQRHVIFNTMEGAVKQPANYADDEWMEAETAEALDRLVGVTALVFHEGWRLTIFYYPVEDPVNRIEMRLSVANTEVHIGSRGATLRNACGDLIRNAAQQFSAFARRDS